MIPGFLWGGSLNVFDAEALDQDLALLGDLGLGAVMVPLSWARLCPKGEGALDQGALASCDRAINALVAMDIEPILCLYQDELPVGLEERFGGWQAREVLEAFIPFAGEVIERYRGRSRLLIPIHDQNLAPYVDQIRQGVLRYRAVEAYQAMHHMHLAFAHAARIARQGSDPYEVGGMVNYIAIYPDQGHPEDVLLAQRMQEDLAMRTLEVFARGKYCAAQRNDWTISGHGPAISNEDWELLLNNTADFLGFGYFMSGNATRADAFDIGVMETLLAPENRNNPFAEIRNMELSIDPLGLRYAMNQLHNRFQKPLFLLECGMGVDERPGADGGVDDTYRIDFYRAHMQALRCAMLEDGVPCKGMLCQAPVDRLQGDGRRYGLIWAQDGKRVPKTSFAWYAGAVASNGLEL